MNFYPKKLVLTRQFHIGIQKEHSYHFLSSFSENVHDNRFGIKNSHFFLGIFYGNKTSILPFFKNNLNANILLSYLLPSSKNVNQW